MKRAGSMRGVLAVLGIVVVLAATSTVALAKISGGGGARPGGGGFRPPGGVTHRPYPGYPTLRHFYPGYGQIYYFGYPYTAPDLTCLPPESLPGSVVDVTLTDMGATVATGGTMQVFASPQTVPAGTVSFRVANTGTLVHDLVVLPLASGQLVGKRAVGSDNRVSESGSLGEASSSCAAGAGSGINPSASGWVTLDLPAGNYELVSNLAGQYAAGMYVELHVS